MNRLLRSRPWFGDWYVPTKPDNARIDEAFEAYLADYAACESAGHWLHVGNPTP